MGTLHGGILCDIADAVMGMAFASTLAPEESFTTVELKINFFRPVWQAQLRAEGMVVRRGATIGYVECTITDEENRLVARGASTCMVLRGQRASGRQSHSALAARIQRSQIASQRAFRVPLENFAAARRYWSKILRDVMRPNCLFCHLIGVMGHGDMENASRFPHPHTPGDDYGQLSNKALH
jgi:uncharacterized protein (TIGR00369 family)